MLGYEAIAATVRPDLPIIQNVLAASFPAEASPRNPSKAGDRTWKGLFLGQVNSTSVARMSTLSPPLMLELMFS